MCRRKCVEGQRLDSRLARGWWRFGDFAILLGVLAPCAHLLHFSMYNVPIESLTQCITPMRDRMACFAVISFLMTGLSASEPGFPDADALLREATELVLQSRPGTAEIEIKHRILSDKLEHGDYVAALEYVESFSTERREKADVSVFFDQKVLPAILDSFDIDLYKRYLKLVSVNGSYRDCNKIVQHCFAHGRLMDESLQLLQELTENQHGHNSILAKELSNTALARECSTIEADGSVTLTAQRTAFRLYSGYNSGRGEERFLVAKWLWVHASHQEKVYEAIRLTKAGEDEKAKTLFTEIFNAIPNRGTPDLWGTQNPSDILCAIALIQIELGKPDWAKELIPKIVIPPRDMSMQQYALGLRLKIADLQLMLSDPAAARKTIEELGKPIVPLVWCDLAIALAKHGDKQGAKELLEKVCDALETETHPVVVERNAEGLFDAVLEMDDPELIQLAIDRALKASETHNAFDKPKEEIKRVVLKVLCRLQRLDEARELLPTIERNYQSRRDYIDALIAAKRYDEAENYVESVRDGGTLFVETMRKTAQAKFTDGDKEGAIAALRKAYGLATTSAQLRYTDFDTVLDIKKFEGTEHSSWEIVEEVFQSHHATIAKVLNDSKKFTAEELRHLLLIIGRARYSRYEHLLAIVLKLRELGESIYPNITAAALETSDGNAATAILRVFDVSKADPQKLREHVMTVWDNLPNNGELQTFCFEIFDKIGTPEDVSYLLGKVPYSLVAFHSGYSPTHFGIISKIADAPQWGEIERAVEDMGPNYVERYDVPFREGRLEHWNRELKPAIDRALQTIRERQ